MNSLNLPTLLLVAVAAPSTVLCDNQIGCFSGAFSLLFFSCFEPWTSILKFWVYVRPKAELLCVHFSRRLQDSSTLEPNVGLKPNEVYNFEEVEFRQEPLPVSIKKNKQQQSQTNKPTPKTCFVSRLALTSALIIYVPFYLSQRQAVLSHWFLQGLFSSASLDEAHLVEKSLLSYRKGYEHYLKE